MTASDRFEITRYDDTDGYNGLGSGCLYIIDSIYGEPVHDRFGLLITFDIEEGDVKATQRTVEKYINQNYDMLVELSDKEYGKEPDV